MWIKAAIKALLKERPNLQPWLHNPRVTFDRRTINDYATWKKVLAETRPPTED